MFMKRFLYFVLLGILLFACEKAPEEVRVESVSLSQPTAEMLIGESVQLSTTVLPSNATDKTVIWASSKQSVATVTESGRVTAIAEGVSTITASASGKSATCMVTVSKGYVAVSSVTLNKQTLSLEKGASETLSATVLPADATNKTVTWTTSNSSIANVDQSGKVTAIGGGSATITAKADNQTATCTVAVTVPVTSISLDRESLTLEEEGTTVLTATIEPADATDKTITWSSSNTAIVTVDNAGKVTAVKEGSAIITAKAGAKEAKCAVTVQKKVIPVSSITLNKTSLSLEKGASETLTATVSPEDATDKTVTWNSSNAEVASVDENGKVTANSGGEAIIMAKAGEKTATCTVTVTVPVTSISLDRESLTLEEESTAVLTATIKPADATDKTITWSSSNTAIVTVDNAGKVTAVKEGSAIITAKAGAKEAKCAVTVQKKVIPVSSITLNKTTLSLEKGTSETLTATVGPEDATDKTVTWSSSNAEIASVDEHGKVTAHTGGEAVITAKAGEKAATCTVTVTVPVESITLNKTALELYEGKSEVLKATVKPDDATDSKVTWGSSDKEIAAVDGEGKVTAIGAGETIITAMAGGKTASCKVVVKKDTSAEAIVFADQNVKEKLVAAFDTNGDGELSYAEAAAVKSLGNAFGNETNYKSFDEFQYFTGVTIIRDSQFSEWQISSIILPGTITDIRGYAFKNCVNLSAIKIPDSVRKIWGAAFWGCIRLSEIVIPEGVTEIGNSAFHSCTSLSSITIPQSITVIGGAAFVDCNNLTRVNISNLEKWLNLQAITNSPFFSSQSGHIYLNGSEVKEVIIPSGMNLDYILYGCVGITRVTIPEGTTTIGSHSFAYCSGLTSMYIPESVSAIQDYAFFHCDNLKSINIPKKLTMIGEDAFGGCQNLMSISIPENINIIDKKAFLGAKSLKELYINDLIKWLKLDKSDYRHPFCSSTSGRLYIGGEEVTEVIIPEIVDLSYAFFGCTSLKTIIIPTGTKVIGCSAFQYCSFESIKIPESIEQIDDEAFYMCKRLTSIEIPATIKSIGKWAFYACSNLNSITLKATTPPALSTEVFKSTNGCPIYVPAGSVESYKNAEQWKNYASRIQAIPE